MWPAPATIASVASGTSAAMRSAAATNLASRAPATSSTGIVSAGRRSHSGSWVPVPARRRLDARPADGVAAAVVEPGGRRSAANSGWASQRVEERVEAVALDRRRPARSSAARRAARSSASSMPGRRADQHEALDEVGSGDGEVQAEPAAHRVADVRGPPAGRAEQVGAVDRSACDVGRAAVAGRVDGDDLVVARRGGRPAASHERPVWVKPWTRTSRGPAPRARRRRARSAGTFGRPPGGAAPARTRPGPGRRGSTSGRR